MFRIGEFSKLCGLSADTLYHYEKQKILTPKSVDEFTGYRYYDASVQLLLDMLENKAQLLESTLAEENNRLKRLHTNIFLIKNGGIPQMNEIIIKTVEPILVASTRRFFEKMVLMKI